jgi:hypothetical protein
MPIALKNIRDLMLPGLQQVASQKIAADQYREMFEATRQAFGATRQAIDNNLYAAQFASKPVDPPFTLEELHEATDLIEELQRG